MSGKVPENRVFVGGLSWDVGEHELEDAFRRYGKITDVQVLSRLCYDLLYTLSLCCVTCSLFHIIGRATVLWL